MADGRHFENSFIAVSESEITRFKWNLVCRCRLCFQGRLLSKIPKFCKFKMADGRHIAVVLLPSDEHADVFACVLAAFQLSLSWFDDPAAAVVKDMSHLTTTPIHQRDGRLRLTERLYQCTFMFCEMLSRVDNKCAVACMNYYKLSLCRETCLTITTTICSDNNGIKS